MRGLNPARSRDDGSLISWSSHRPPLTPDEVRRLPGDQSLVFISGCAPILATKARYFADREFRAYRDAGPCYGRGRQSGRLAPQRQRLNQRGHIRRSRKVP